ncbi:MAG TPA: hypothetical protein VFE84_13575, partial [Patescibacteria group bacterium]|nr:hypothetical protein [Patescibacteria group bacterium]
PFFSRRVGLAATSSAPVPIMGGVKLAGRVGRYNLGFLTVNTDSDVDTPQTNFTVLRVSRDILTRSNVGLLGVSKEPVGRDSLGDPNDPEDDIHSNRTYGADMNFSVLQNFKFGGSILETRTPGLGGGRGAGNAYATWTNDTWRMELYYRDIGTNFNPEAGFVQRTGIEEVETALGWSWRSDTALLRHLEPHTRFIYTMDQDRQLATRRQHWGTTFEFRNGSEIEVAYNPLFDKIVGDPFVLRDDDGDPNTRGDNVEIRPGAYHPTQWLVLYQGDASRVLSGSTFIEFGGFFDGRYRSIDVNGTARISKHVRTVLGVNHTAIDLPSRPDDDPDPLISTAAGPSQFNTTLIQGRLGVGFTTRIFFDALLQYNTAIEDFSSNLRFNYKYRPGSDIYVVYNERRDIEGVPTDKLDRSFTIKWTYLMAF